MSSIPQSAVDWTAAASPELLFLHVSTSPHSGTASDGVMSTASCSYSAKEPAFSRIPTESALELDTVQ